MTTGSLCFLDVVYCFGVLMINGVLGTCLIWKKNIYFIILLTCRQTVFPALKMIFILENKVILLLTLSVSYGKEKTERKCKSRL